MEKSKQLFRVEWMWNGNWRMDDENHAGMTRTRHLSHFDADCSEKMINGQYPAMKTRIVAEEAR